MTTTCPCISVEGLPVQLDPDEAVNLKVIFDPAHDPDFEGRLSAGITGYLSEGRIGFQTKVELEVSKERNGGAP